jgi:hypothetical protein
MINKTDISQDKRTRLESALKKEYPKLTFEYSPAFDHYYISSRKTGEKSANISTFELYSRYIDLI